MVNIRVFKLILEFSELSVFILGCHLILAASTKILANGESGL
jgi:hypothetical protein